MIAVLSIIICVLDFTVPGYAWILLTGISKRVSLFGKAAFSFVLSLCFLGLSTASLSIVTSDYLLYAAILPLVALVIIVAFARGERFGVKVGKELLPVGVVLAVYTAITLLHFWSAPFYPDAITDDPARHAQIVVDILQGNGRNVLLHSNYPTGLHFAVALFASLTSLSALESLRILLTLVMLAALSLVYETAYAIWKGHRVAGFVALVAAFAVPAEPTLFISLGLYPNLTADAIILIMLWLIFAYISKPSWKLGVTFATVSLAGVFTHSSVLLFLGVVWVFIPFVFFLFRQRLRAYLEVALYSISILTLFAVAFLPIFSGALARVLGYSRLTGPFTLRLFTARYLTLWISYYLYVGSVGAGVIGASIILFAVRYRTDLARLLMLLWTALLTAGVFLTSQPWRLFLFTLVPGYFLVGNLVSSSSELTVRAIIAAKRASQLIPVGLLIFLIASGTFPGLVARTYNPTTRARQIAVFESMQWLSRNGCADGVLSVGLGQDYSYLQALTGLKYVGDYEESANSTLNQSAGLGFHCVAVSAEDVFLPNFESTTTFEQKYRNSFVVIFFITQHG
jgi:hypothetical protein